MTRFDLLLRGGTCATPNGLEVLDIGVAEGRIQCLGAPASSDADKVVDVAGLHVLPGVIDSQVHFREPGLEHKEDLATGTASAALGGVTSIFEMPNTSPSTDSTHRLEEKLERAAGRAWTDYGFFVGATGANSTALAALERVPGCVGVKVFMGSSTGTLLVDDDATLGDVLRSGRRRVAVHCEDEKRLLERKHIAEAAGHPRAHPLWRDEESCRLATARLLRLAEQHRRPVHVLHVTTAEEMELLSEHRHLATVEVTPQHLTLCAPECYESLGAHAQMNPPIRGVEHRDALWRAIRDGVVDAIGSDHAPHTQEEKARPYPQCPSGMPGVQTLLPLMLDHVHHQRLSLLRLVDLLCAGPQRVYGVSGKGRLVRGYDADFSIVDLKRLETIEESWLGSKCGWSPFVGRKVNGWPVATVVRGQVVMREGELQGDALGQPVQFLGQEVGI